MEHPELCIVVVFYQKVCARPQESSQPSEVVNSHPFKVALFLVGHVEEAVPGCQRCCIQAVIG